jgi:transposase InsO family protein
MVTRGLSERHAPRVVRMSTAALRYQPRPDQDGDLRERIHALAHRHRRYGAGMIYLKLRQEGRVVNHKRVDRLYAEARLQVKRRRRKKVPIADRRPLARPQAPNHGSPASRTRKSSSRPGDVSTTINYRRKDSAG